MKKLNLTTYILLITAMAINAQQNEFPKLTGSYFGQKTPGKTAEVFAKGIISIPESKYCTISFSGKMDEFYLSS